MFESSVSTDPAVGRNLRGHLRADRKYADILKLTTTTGGGREGQGFEPCIALKPAETRRHAILLFILLECFGVLAIYVSR